MALRGSDSQRLAVRSEQQRLGPLGRRGVGLVRRKRVDSGAVLAAATALAPSSQRLLELRPGLPLAPLQPVALANRRRLAASVLPMWPRRLLEQQPGVLLAPRPQVTLANRCRARAP